MGRDMQLQSLGSIANQSQSLLEILAIGSQGIHRMQTGILQKIGCGRFRFFLNASRIHKRNCQDSRKAYQDMISIHVGILPKLPLTIPYFKTDNPLSGLIDRNDPKAPAKGKLTQPSLGKSKWIPFHKICMVLACGKSLNDDSKPHVSIRNWQQGGSGF